MASLPTEDAGTGAISPGKGGLFSKAGMDTPDGGTGWWTDQSTNWALEFGHFADS